MRDKIVIARALIAVIATLLPLTGLSAQDRSRRPGVDGREVTILVTAHPHSDRTREAAAALRRAIFLCAKRSDLSRYYPSSEQQKCL